jgi:hypothetical protein
MCAREGRGQLKKTSFLPLIPGWNSRRGNREVRWRKRKPVREGSNGGVGFLVGYSSCGVEVAQGRLGVRLALAFSGLDFRSL